MYKIRIEKQKLNFAAAHFITFENECEALHGHNYYTSVEIGGQPDENHYIVDFKVVKGEMAALCDLLDHKTLIATKNERLKVETSGQSVRVAYQEREYVFPRGDVVLLDIPNTTVEMLSEFLCNGLKCALDKNSYLKKADYIEVGVEESRGQMASFRINLGK
ncbi:MAG: 6-carboxytetrahydropterin synthase [Nitrospinae bacterium]|nr:6-carboxytetrahydropterin synthase [Nitrospinota bacterium]